MKRKWEEDEEDTVSAITMMMMKVITTRGFCPSANDELKFNSRLSRLSFNDSHIHPRNSDRTVTVSTSVFEPRLAEPRYRAIGFSSPNELR